jgi:hypothetical protein
VSASGQTNWRVPQNFSDWSMGIEKRLMHEERRKPAPAEGQTFVPGIGSMSVRLFDWNDDAALLNGFWYAAPGAINGPDVTNNSWFLGRTQVDEDGFGIQFANSHRPNPASDSMSWPTLSYQRRFYVPVAGGLVQFSGWEAVDPSKSDNTRNATGAFSGSIRFYRIDSLVNLYGVINRASGFNAVFASVGAGIPAACTPVGGAQALLPASPIWGTASDQFQFRANFLTGFIELRQSAATSTDMICQGAYFL